MEIKVIKRRFLNADYPPKFLNSVMHQFFTPKNNDSFIIPPDLFEESKPFILAEIPYCEKTKMLPNILLRNSIQFTVTELINIQIDGNQIDNRKGKITV